MNYDDDYYDDAVEFDLNAYLLMLDASDETVEPWFEDGAYDDMEKEFSSIVGGV